MISERDRLVGERTLQMRCLAEEDRRTAIAAATNVIGHKRFLARLTEVERRHSYRHPQC